MKQKLVEKEWKVLIKKENKLRAKKEREQKPMLAKVEQHIPEKFQGMLTVAFTKAFQEVFERGNGLVTAMVCAEKHEKEYQIHQYVAQMKQNRKSMKQFAKKAHGTKRKNELLTALEGFSLGILGIGLPDIPIFIAVILKSVYQISLDFGFDYETPKERVFILNLVTGALETGTDFLEIDEKIDDWIQNPQDEDWEEQLEIQKKQTAEVVSKGLLSMKFIQGLPIVGIAGGAFNWNIIGKITHYAILKYHKRYLWNILQENTVNPENS